MPLINFDLWGYTHKMGIQLMWQNAGNFEHKYFIYIGRNREGYFFGKREKFMLSKKKLSN